MNDRIIAYVAKLRAHGRAYRVAVGMAADRFGVTRERIDALLADLP